MNRRFNVLVCTTIIETGIDVPSANTIIINRSDRFGLAQLHQLRGRVGRSHHRAYAYLLAPPNHAMTADAVKRLEAIESLEDLGIGFSLATHDLEIRGAGADDAMELRTVGPRDQSVTFGDGSLTLADASAETCTWVRLSRSRSIPPSHRQHHTAWTPRRPSER